MARSRGLGDVYKRQDLRWIKKGMVLLDKNPICFREFLAKIHVHQVRKGGNSNNSHTTTIRVNYEPTVHLMNIRQNCKILAINNKISKRLENDNVLTGGDIANVLFQFKFRPHYIKIGEKILLTEGNIKAVGEVIEIFP
jgi:elongation factor 1-alpha